jgi:hypothetical protein
MTSIAVDRPAAAAFAFVTDPEKLDRWSFGTWETEIAPDGLIRGTSLFDGGVIYVRIDPDAARGGVDYHIGADPARLIPRIVLRVVEGPHLGLPEDRSVISMLTWRGADMDDHRWRKLTATHEMEIVLLKSLIEGAP